MLNTNAILNRCQVLWDYKVGNEGEIILLKLEIETETYLNFLCRVVKYIIYYSLAAFLQIFSNRV